MAQVMSGSLKGFAADLELDEIATVKEVIVSSDLQVAKVYISLYRIGADDDDEPPYDTWDRLVKLQP